MAIFNYCKTLYQAKLMPNKIIWLNSIQSLFAFILPITIIAFLGKNEKSILLGCGLSFLLGGIIMTKIDWRNLFIK